MTADSGWHAFFATDPGADTGALGTRSRQVIHRHDGDEHHQEQKSSGGSNLALVQDGDAIPIDVVWSYDPYEWPYALKPKVCSVGGIRRMTEHPATGIQWLGVEAAAVAVIAPSFFGLTIIVTGYVLRVAMTAPYHFRSRGQQ
jgi:hypothetical protein